MVSYIAQVKLVRGIRKSRKSNTYHILNHFVILLFALAIVGCFIEYNENLAPKEFRFRKLEEVRVLPYSLRHFGSNLNLANPEEKIYSGVSNIVDKLRHHESNAVIGTWPVSIRDETETKWDTIVHPGDVETEMKVPKFWSRPIHNGSLISRHIAQSIGTCIEPDTMGNYNRGDDCPLHQRTIFVSIASYRDFRCRQTVESIFLRAAYPDRVRVGVVDQIISDKDVSCNLPMISCDTDAEQALCKYSKHIDVYEMDAALGIGPVFARHIGNRLYRGEYYATQSDAHVTYIQNWDSDIIDQFESTNNEMAVLSTYLSGVKGSIDEHGHSQRQTRPIMCNTVYESGSQGMMLLRHVTQPETMPEIHGMPQLSPWWAAGFSFSRGHFVVNVPYDWLQPWIFQGEEMSIGIRGFTIGYDYYAPERSVCFHHYSTTGSTKESKRHQNTVHYFWENKSKYERSSAASMKRLLGIVHMSPEVAIESWNRVEEEFYGIGGVRTPEKFFETFGIDIKEKTIEENLCSFVNDRGQMHKMFQPLLRSDGMGIDYTGINYRFKGPTPSPSTTASPSPSHIDTLIESSKSPSID
jgi:[Skp1-protein]-hydroxyproline N-acetylglucosaminyltransferase